MNDMDLDFYLDQAKRNKGIKSDAELSRLVGFKSNAVTFFRCKKAFPSDQTMVRIAELAGVDPRRALLDLNIMRSDGEPKAAYMQMAAILAQHARHVSAMILVCFGVLILAASPAHAGGQTGNGLAHNMTNIYIITQTRRAISFLRQRLAALFCRAGLVAQDQLYLSLCV